ncbi:aminopeptidase [Dactylosporangium sp. NPDC000555]|uniref:aminopeptidase n=1 Tax=Dactylosporangium sp. NPDC000555 TaxID=3154260 RepID=UPI003332444D
MRLVRVLVVVSGGAGVLAVIAALFSAWQVSLQCGSVALATLVGYVLVAGRAAHPRVRWAIAAGVGLLAAVLAMRLFWFREPSGGLVVDDVLSASIDERGAPWRRGVDQERIAAVGQLLGVLCLAAGVLGLPRRRWPKRGVLTTVLAVLLLVVVGADVAGRVDGGAVLDLLGIVWPALLATLVAVAVLALAGRRGDRGWLLPGGALLVAVAQAIAFSNLMGTASAWLVFSDFDGVASVATGLTVAVGGSPDASAAVEVAVALAGPVLLAIGALRAARESRPVEPVA